MKANHEGIVGSDGKVCDSLGCWCRPAPVLVTSKLQLTLPGDGAMGGELYFERASDSFAVNLNGQLMFLELQKAGQLRDYLNEHLPVETSGDVVAAARELLRLKDLATDAEAIETSGSWDAVHRRDAMFAEYRAKKGAAWDALRRALQVETKAPRIIGMDLGAPDGERTVYQCEHGTSDAPCVTCFALKASVAPGWDANGSETNG
jgi:hypothetical protein